MDEILKALMQLLPNLTKSQARQLVKTLGLEDAELVTSVEDISEDNSTKAVTVAEMAKELKSLGYQPALPGMPEPEGDKTKKSVSPPYDPNPITPGEEDGDDANAVQQNMKSMQSVNVMRSGNDEDGMKAAKAMIMKDIVGPDYVAKVYEQNIAFAKYLRGGLDAIHTENERRLLKTMVFPEEHIFKAILDGGLDVRTIKAVQIESQGELGGIAVPPNRQAEIDARLPGLTAIRGSGARVVTLVNSNSIEIPKWRGDSNRWIGLLRGTWGEETQDPAAQNFKLDMQPVVAYIYTYKVPLSQSVVEDAANLISMLMTDISTTLAIDEDEVFVTGDGVNKPMGLLPNDTNFHSLTERVTGDADDVTALGLKGLKRGVPSQYRRNAVWIGNSDTWGEVESLRDDSGASAGTGQFLFPDLSDNDMLLGRKAWETEAMPDIAANAYPIIFGWMYGYTIVERLGMAIERFHDSNTGINKVEYHVRRRIGGDVERPYMLAVQKVAAGDPFS